MEEKNNIELINLKKEKNRVRIMKWRKANSDKVKKNEKERLFS